jgi:Family of unknown function (DUF6459)
MPTLVLRAKLAHHESKDRAAARAQVRRHLGSPAKTAATIAITICEVEAGHRPAAHLEALCHHTLWEAIATRIRRSGGPPTTTRSRIRVHFREDTPGLVDAVVVVQRGRRVEPIAMRLDVAPGYWQVVELQY